MRPVLVFINDILFGFHFLVKNCFFAYGYLYMSFFIFLNIYLYIDFDIYLCWFLSYGLYFFINFINRLLLPAIALRRRKRYEAILGIHYDEIMNTPTHKVPYFYASLATIIMITNGAVMLIFVAPN